MKFVKFGIFALSMSLFIASCGGSSTTDSTKTDSTSTTTAPAAAPAPAATPAPDTTHPAAMDTTKKMETKTTETKMETKKK